MTDDKKTHSVSAGGPIISAPSMATYDPKILLDPQRECPLCGGADQHADDCRLRGKHHVYIGDVVHWEETKKINGIE